MAGVVTFQREERAQSLAKIDYRERHLHRRESIRWWALISAVAARMGDVDPVHVMDREADDFQLFSRLNAKRAAPTIAAREVPLSPRAGKRGGRSERTHPVRHARTARLSVAAVQIDLEPPRDLRTRFAPISLGAVLVTEPKPPAGEAPVEWMLLTSEPVASSEQALAVVDIYRARWTIEEFFKALKTGCAIERRQLESAAALGIFAPLAVRLLALRHQARDAPTGPATALFSQTELDALRVLARSPLPKRPTVLDAVLAVAALGGHLKRNGPPGWLVLSRGLEKLEVAAQLVSHLAVGTRTM